MRYHLIALALVGLDQFTKIMVKGFSLAGFQHEGMYLGQSYPLLGDVVRITYVENAGMAFGISWGEAKVVLTFITILIAGFLGYYLYTVRFAKLVTRISITLLFAGAVGNLIDRSLYGVIYGEAGLFMGRVVDFIQVDIPDVTWFGSTYTHWPVFNVADSCVFIGIVLLILTGGRTHRERA